MAEAYYNGLVIHIPWAATIGLRIRSGGAPDIAAALFFRCQDFPTGGNVISTTFQWTIHPDDATGARREALSQVEPQLTT